MSGPGDLTGGGQRSGQADRNAVSRVATDDHLSDKRGLLLSIITGAKVDEEKAHLVVNRLGFGAMRLTGSGVWGEFPDRDVGIAC